MKLSIRASTPADLPAIVELMRAAGLNSNVEDSELHWKYWRGREDWPGSRSYVVTNGVDILAHTGIIPGGCLWKGQRLRAIHMMDWAARPGIPGTGVALVKYVARLADVLLAIGGSMLTRKILPLVGFRSFGNATEFVRSMHPIRPLKSGMSPLWKALPRYARSVAWTATAHLRSRGWFAQPVGPGDIESLEASLPRGRADEVVFERSPTSLRYLLDCPIARMELYSLEREGRIHGYFMLAFAAAEARLVDAWVDSDDLVDWRGLIRCAIRCASRNGDVYTMRSLSSSARQSIALQQCGFRGSEQLPLGLLGAESLIPDGVGLRVQMLDFDEAYLWHPPVQGLSVRGQA